MFCGIVSGFCEVMEVTRKGSFASIAISLPQDLRHGTEIGASIAIDGVCLTVTAMRDDLISFDVIEETLRVTTLGGIKEHDFVNVERSLKANTEVGGHIVSGHVDGVATIQTLERTELNCSVILSVEPEWSKYIFPKGFIALNGVSLTVGFVDRTSNRFAVYLIPETLRRTNFSLKKSGDKVNFEVDRQTQTIVDTMNIFLDRLEQKLLNSQNQTLSLEHTDALLDEMVPAITNLKKS